MSGSKWFCLGTKRDAFGKEIRHGGRLVQMHKRWTGEELTESQFQETLREGFVFPPCPICGQETTLTMEVW